MKPKNLLQRNSVGRFLKRISGREISTPMDSSKRELLDELLDIIQEMSSIHWQDDLDLSMTSCTSSSDTEDSSESDYEVIKEAPMEGPPPIGAPDPPPQKKNKVSFRYTPF
nr:ORF3 [Torque teno felis virus]